jgi:hypothetical protein
MKITLNGEAYELDIDKAIKLGVITPLSSKITDFIVGDVFSSSNHSQIVVVQPVWGSIDYDRGAKIYGFVGNRGEFFSYAEHKELLSYDDVVDYINKNDLEFKGNVGEVLIDALAKMVGEDFCAG